MKRIAILITMIICAWQTCQAQINYLHNPSFEQYWRCPLFYDEIKFANYWSPIDTSNTFPAYIDTFGDPDCTPEFCHACATNANVSVPTNVRFNHYARTGNGMAQVMMYYNEYDSTSLYKRDYLQGRLKQTLQPGVQYCVTFYVVAEAGSGYAIDHIGAYFDDGEIDTTNNCGFPQTTHIPQIVETSIISDKVNWTKIQGTFIATGTENFVTIGNFYDAAHTDTISVASTLPDCDLAWYLIDDISVIEVDSAADAGRDTTILAGDTAWIGNHDDYLPCKWYLATTGALIDSNHAGLAVHPSMTTSYVMELDVCGALSYDTVTVTIHPTETEASPRPSPKEREVLLPNPARDYVTVTGVVGTTNYRVVSSVGISVQSGVLDKNSNRILLSYFPSGIYIVELIDSDGVRNNLRLVKE